MFAKVFSQIFDSSLAQRRETRWVFMDLLVLSDENGVVDMTQEAIARRTNVPEEIVRQAISELESPDPRSRSKAENGARLKRLHEHRDWGWLIINFHKYRAIRNHSDRAQYQRDWDKQHRPTRPNSKYRQPDLPPTTNNLTKHNNTNPYNHLPPTTPDTPDNPRQPPTYAEAEAEAEGGSTNVSGFSAPSPSKNSSHSPSISPSVLVIKNQTELKRVEAALDALRAKHHNESWPKSAITERDRLRTRRQDLLHKLKFAV